MSGPEWPEHGIVAAQKREIDRLEKSRGNWKQCAQVQQKDIQRMIKEIERLRSLLRSMPKSFGVTEKEIEGEEEK